MLHRCGHDDDNACMSSPAIHGRLFLIGCARAGTTLLQSFIAAHSRIASFPESQVFPDLAGRIDDRMFGDRSREGLKGAIRLRLGLAYKHGTNAILRIGTFLDAVERPQWKAELPRVSRRIAPLARTFIGMLDRLALERGCDLWLEKTPRHLDYVDIIERYVPDAKFINILRRGEDNVASLYDMAKRYPELESWRPYADLDRCIARWNMVAARTAALLGRRNHLLVHYDDLIADPRRVMIDLCRFIGIDFEPGMIEQRAAAADGVVVASESWKADVAGDLRTDRNEKFAKLFTPEQQRYIRGRLRSPSAPGRGKE